MGQVQRGIRKIDYLVVGAGAAGCTFGFLMKKAGADVLLLEMQNAEQRDKLCAGILENRAELAFQDIFGETVDEAGLAPVLVENICLWNGGYEWRRPMPGRRPETTGAAGSQPEPKQNKGLASSLGTYLKNGGKVLAKKVIQEALGYNLGKGFTFQALPRKRFDDYIRDRYLVEGGQILNHTKVCSINENEKLAACIDLHTKEQFSVQYKFIIGADGAMSYVRRLLNGKHQKTVCVFETGVPLIRSDTVVGFIPGAQGYCWYVPWGKDAAFGCGFHNLGGREYEICRERLAGFAEYVGIEMPARLRGAYIPAEGNVLLQPGKNAILLGDAAGLTDAFTGGGIHYALLSAQALAAYFAGGPSYEDAMRTHVDLVRRSAKNFKQYNLAACSVISGFGKKL